MLTETRSQTPTRCDGLSFILNGDPERLLLLEPPPEEEPPLSTRSEGIAGAVVDFFSAFGVELKSTSGTPIPVGGTSPWTIIIFFALADFAELSVTLEKGVAGEENEKTKRAVNNKTEIDRVRFAT